MPTPLDNIRRIELLEQQLLRQQSQLDALLGRRDRASGKRWHYLAITATEEESVYPDDGDTFHLNFVDRTPMDNLVRAEFPLTTGRTLNGQWVLEGELVSVFPEPPAPGSGGGRWCIVPQKTYYWGQITDELVAGGSVSANVWKRDSGWVNTGFTQTVWDAMLLEDATLAAGTIVRFEWESELWLVSSASCGPHDILAEEE